MKIRKVLSGFDGMSCGRLALMDAGIEFDGYYASEIDKHAIYQTTKMFPDTIHLGDITKWSDWLIDWSECDLFIFGSPCQGFSRAGKGLNFDDPRSKLFFVCVDILNHIRKFNPNVLFMMENVDMDKWCLGVISRYLGVYPVNINSNLVSAQNRNRWYWTNIQTRKEGLFGEIHTDIPQPKDQKIYMKDILQHEKDIDHKYYVKTKELDHILNTEYGRSQIFIQSLDNSEKGVPLTARSYRAWKGNYVKIDRNGRVKKDQQKAGCFTAGVKSGGNHSDMDLIVIGGINRGVLEIGGIHAQSKRVYSTEGKGVSLCALGGGGGAKTGLYFTNINYDYAIRRLTPREVSRLQTIPEWYKWYVSDTQIYRMCGNGWTIKVISHIFSFMKKKYK